MNRSAPWGVAVGGLILAMLACTAEASTMDLQGQPAYICPSSTPRSTNTALPPDPPRYLPVFTANLSHYFVDLARNTVILYVTAQNVGVVTAQLVGTTTAGSFWSGGSFTVAYTGNYPGYSVSYPIFIPASVRAASISVSHAYGVQSFSVNRISTVFNATSQPSNSVYIPPPIYPTPRPTFTPYPSPTLYRQTSDFFLDDPVYNYPSSNPAIRLRLRLKNPIVHSTILSFLFVAAAWQLEITNVGSVEYSYLGGLYSYVSEIRGPLGVQAGVWSPSHQAATYLFIIEESYHPRSILPGQSILVHVAAFIPANSKVSKLSFVLKPYQYGDPGWESYTPAQLLDGVATWINRTNTICRGEIANPR